MSEQVGIRQVFIDIFLGSAVSVSKQVGIRLVFIHMFLGSVVSVSKQVDIRPVFRLQRCSLTCF